jgi:hypothetical protein
MYRVEIIANRSVEENLLEALRDEGAGKFYTKYPNVLGSGSSGPRMGDAIWPEENFALVIWCEEDEAEAINRAVGHVKEHFPDEGVKIFGLPGQLSMGRAPAPGGAPPPRGSPVDQPPGNPPPESAPPAEPRRIGDVGEFI